MAETTESTAPKRNVETGWPTEFRGAHVFDFEDGKIVRWTSYADGALFIAACQD